MNKPGVYLGLPILELGKIVMYEFQFDCVKQKFEEKAKTNLCYINTDKLTAYVKPDDIYT